MHKLAQPFRVIRLCPRPVSFWLVGHQEAPPLGGTLPRGRFDAVDLPHVSLHQQPLGEELGAVVALVGPLLLVLGQHVLPQRGAAVEGPIAHVAAEGLFARVGPDVLRHVALQFETLAAEVAAVGPLARVHPHVVLQVALAGDLLAADVTVEVAAVLRRLALVRFQVPRQHCLLGEDQVAYVAAVQGGPHHLLRLLRILLGRPLRLSPLLLLLGRSAVLQLLHRLDQLLGQGVAVVVALLRRGFLLTSVDPHLLPLLVLLLFDLGGALVGVTVDGGPDRILTGRVFLRWRCSWLLGIWRWEIKMQRHITRSFIFRTVWNMLIFAAEMQYIMGWVSTHPMSL